ncbi:beta-galactosidase [Thozetella sp. PMI_491]|nr:beta-galactosidase [Thozetella sp. PMI_491]
MSSVVKSWAYATLRLVLLGMFFLGHSQLAEAYAIRANQDASHFSAGRERVSLNQGWRFSRFTSSPDSLSYSVLRPWILPSANDFLSGSKYERPSGAAPGGDVDFVQSTFDDSTWQAVNLPHDWAVQGPFGAPGISGGMGRLPSNGVGWYRRKIAFSADDTGKSIFLDIDGAMSYAAVFLNGNLVGGWPYGYSSWRLDLTPYITVGDENILAIRLDNALDSSRWYPGGGIYRNVWLVKTDPTHVAQFGTYITTPSVSSESATVDLIVEVENKGNGSARVDVVTEVRALDPTSRLASVETVATFPRITVEVASGAKTPVNGSITIASPLLWGPPPEQKPSLYVAVTTILSGDNVIDTYETPFGIRSLTLDPDQGVLINGQPVRVQGTCNHHDQGSLGAAFHIRAAERQLEMLQEMGSNALRTSHNPPAPEFLDLADQMGFMVLDELFDCWKTQKTTNDYHLLFDDWHEPDLRAFIRRDRNHPSIIAWSFGNEIPEQTSAAGGTIGKELHDMMHEEDPTRLSTMALNSATAGSAAADVLDIESLNYQGEGRGTSTNYAFPSFRSAYPNKMIWTSESSSVLSTRGTYIFPVTSDNNAVVGPSAGEDTAALYVSAYDLYAPSWGASPDKVFTAQDKFSYVAGEFVWTGWDYLGEPTPFDSQARSSYFGIIDLAGFKKDRFYLYQSRWRPDLPMAHILPHWSWPDRLGEITPVHVYSSADEAELFVNGESAGRQTRAEYSYRFRWDNITYQPGDLRVVTYKDGVQWAVDTKKTIGDAAKLTATADRSTISSDGYDLSFISVAVVDSSGEVVPRAHNTIDFSISGPGEIVSTDNGDPTDMTAFPSLSRNAFNGMALAIVRAKVGSPGEITVTASASGLEKAVVTIKVD